MPAHRWTIDMNDIGHSFRKSYKVWDRYYKNAAIDRQKYYEGFNVGREKVMFQQELKDLETVYRSALDNYEKELEEILPSHLYYMEKFLTLKKQSEAISDKLEDLLEKTGRKSQEETGDDECCGGCNE